MPQVHMPDDSLVQAAYTKALEEQARIARARAGGGGSSDVVWWKPLGPNGESKWDQVPVGYEATAIVWLCPPSGPGKMPYVEEASHFYRSREKPGGTGITCMAPEGQCFVCESRNSLFKTNLESDVQLAQSTGKRSRRAIYSLILLESYQDHFTPEGTMKPVVFRAPGGLHDDILSKLQTKGSMRIMDPQHGRPLVIKKRKTGKSNMDVEWSVDDLDPQPLDPAFYPVLSNLYDLDKFVKNPSAADQLEAIQSMGFPIPQGIHEAVQAEAANAAAQGQGGQQQYGQQQPPQQYGQQPAVYQPPPAPQVVQTGYQQPYNANPNPPTQSPYNAPVKDVGNPNYYGGQQPQGNPPQQNYQQPQNTQPYPQGNQSSDPALAALQGQLTGKY